MERDMQVSRVLLLLGLSTLLHAAADATPKQRKGMRVNLALDTLARPETPGRAASFHSFLANTSLSPWTYTESLSASRFPSRIYNAQCLTSNCLSLQGDGEDASLEAKPIYYHTLVLYRVPKQEKAKKRKARSRVKYEFQLRTEVVSVGCTCVRPTSVPQQ